MCSEFEQIDAFRPLYLYKWDYDNFIQLFPNVKYLVNCSTTTNFVAFFAKSFTKKIQTFGTYFI